MYLHALAETFATAFSDFWTGGFHDFPTVGSDPTVGLGLAGAHNGNSAQVSQAAEEDAKKIVDQWLGVAGLISATDARSMVVETA